MYVVDGLDSAGDYGQMKPTFDGMVQLLSYLDEF